MCWKHLASAWLALFVAAAAFGMEEDVVLKKFYTSILEMDGFKGYIHLYASRDRLEAETEKIIGTEIATSTMVAATVAEDNFTSATLPVEVMYSVIVLDGIDPDQIGAFATATEGLLETHRWFFPRNCCPKWCRLYH